MQTTRRRFIGITAAVSASAFLPTAFGKTSTIQPEIWQGVALGADAELRLYHPNRQVAQSLIQQALSEVARLEKIFSIYDENSQISQLNRTGSLNNPAADLLAVLSQSQSIHTLTRGAFDPTVQVLWQRYAAHFAKQPQSKTVPNIQAAMQHVGFDNVIITPQKIAFAKPNMAITLNGIAQGYITDRVTQILQHAGMQHALVNMGETRHLDTLKQHPEIAKIRNPRGAGVLPNANIPLQNQALATSSGYGTAFDKAEQFTHIFEPRTGNSTPRYQSVSVLASTATQADALSTAFAVSSEHNIQAAAQQIGAKVWLVLLNGTVKTLA